MTKTLTVTVWNEGRHEKSSEKVREVYPEGMGAQIAKAFDSHSLWRFSWGFNTHQNSLPAIVSSNMEVQKCSLLFLEAAKEAVFFEFEQSDVDGGFKGSPRRHADAVFLHQYGGASSHGRAVFHLAVAVDQVVEDERVPIERTDTYL